MQLKAQVREKFGKGVEALRRDGLIPAELYGHGVENMHLAVNETDFRKVFAEAGESTIIDLLVGSDTRKALVHEVQRDFVSDEVTHVDFYQVNMKEEITTSIPFDFVGESLAVKELGGLLNRVMSEIEVKALPSDLPHSIQVDISILKELGASIYVKDVSLPGGVKISVDPETVIATVSLPKEEVVEVQPMDVSEVKVESEEKKAEREKDKAESEE